MRQQRPSERNDALPETPTVLVVDDDPEVRDALGSLFRSVRLYADCSPRPRNSCCRSCRSPACCIVLDIRLPGVGGLDFQAQLARAIFASPLS